MKATNNYTITAWRPGDDKAECTPVHMLRYLGGSAPPDLALFQAYKKALAMLELDSGLQIEIMRECE